MAIFKLSERKKLKHNIKKSKNQNTGVLFSQTVTNVKLLLWSQSFLFKLQQIDTNYDDDSFLQAEIPPSGKKVHFMQLPARKTGIQAGNFLNFVKK